MHMQEEKVGTTSGSQRFFTTAHLETSKANKCLKHKIPLVKKTKFAKKVPIEFVEQLLTETQANDAPVFISRGDHIAEIYSYAGELLCELVGHNAEITAAKSLTSTIIVSGDASGELLIWDITAIEDENIGKISKQKNQRKTHNPATRLHEHGKAITSIEAITSNTFISVSLDSSYKYWQTHTANSLQTIDTKHPIHSLVVMSPDDVLYCIPHYSTRENEKIFYCYDIMHCNRSLLTHKVLKNLKYSTSQFCDIITQIKLNPDMQLTFLVQSKSGNDVINSEASLFLNARSPAKILANGRYAFWDGKENVVINLYPLENKPFLTI